MLSTTPDFCLPLNVHDRERNEIKDYSNIERSQNSVENSCNLVEKCSVREFDFRSFVCRLWWVVHHWLEGVVLQGLKVKVGNFHDDLKGNEMDDAMLNSMLVSKQVAADSKAKVSTENLRGSKQEADRSSISRELVRIVVCEFHDVHAIGHLWAKYKVKSQTTRKLNEEDHEWSWKVWGESSTCDIFLFEFIKHTNEQAVGNEMGDQTRIKELRLLCVTYQILVFVNFQISKSGHCHHVFLSLKRHFGFVLNHCLILEVLVCQSFVWSYDRHRYLFFHSYFRLFSNFCFCSFLLALLVPDIRLLNNKCNNLNFGPLSAKEICIV